MKILYEKFLQDPLPEKSVNYLTPRCFFLSIHKHIDNTSSWLSSMASAVKTHVHSIQTPSRDTRQKTLSFSTELFLCTENSPEK